MEIKRNENGKMIGILFDNLEADIDEAIKALKINKKPPLGVKPRNLVMVDRAIELSRVIHEYLENDRKIKPEWLRELYDLIEYIT